jgi:CHAT domain-containing protein
MTTNSRPLEFKKETCLSDVDFYRYLSGLGGIEAKLLNEAHLAKCASCRQNLAELLEILHPEHEQDGMEIPEPSQAELDQTIALIQETSRQERKAKKPVFFRFQWPIAAAAAVGFIAFGLWSFKYFYEVRKSDLFFSQARAILERTYPGLSPGNLRLDLPFTVNSINRSNPGSDASRQAENLLFQALAFRENMIEARLGLADIYLNESKFTNARNEFQKILDIQKENVPALIGRGVAQHEEAIQGSDPAQRNTLLQGALNDFNMALKLNPDSLEARYNKIWTLFENGLHQEALREIERYLSRDPGSAWAEELRGLKTRMRATQTSAVEEEIRRSAPKRDAVALQELAHQAPYQMPNAIMSAMRQSLQLQHVPAVENDRPNSEDYVWAAQTMEAAYSKATGDTSFRAFLAFHVGLSPPQREFKRTLDREVQALNKLYSSRKFDTILSRSKPLEHQYAALRDFWQLADLYHLRGNSFYMGKADLRAAEAEFHKMLAIAEQLHAVDLKAKALGSLAMIYGMKRNFDESLSYANRLKDLAQSHNLQSWKAYACIIRGNQLRRMGQVDESLYEYSAAMGMAYRLLDAVALVEILENLGELADRSSHLEEARTFYKLALQQQDSFLKNPEMEESPEEDIRRLNLLYKQGELALRTKDYASAETFFGDSLNSALPTMHELKGRDCLGLAEVYCSTGRIREAENMLGSAMAISALGQYPEIEWKAKFIKSRLMLQAGQNQQALSLLRQAIEIVEHMRGHIHIEDFRQSFLTDRFDPFKAMVSLLYESVGDNGQTLEFIDRAKSMTLREHLRLQAYASPLKEHPIPAQNTYPVIEYFFTSNELLIFLTRRGQTEAVSQPISAEAMSLQIQEYLESMRRNDSRAYGKMARRLYNELIAPIEEHVFADASETLVILPDGPLHLLPFAGLQDAQGLFMIEKAPIAFAPSRSVLEHCLSLKREKTVDNSSAALIDGSAGLSSAKEELNYLSRLYGSNASILAPKDVPQFKQAVARSRIIHFAGHAITMRGKPVLLLQSSPRKIYLDCQAINTWNMSQAYLVNLAGCNTGIGPLAEGEAPWGLIPAFLNAGSPAIIASLMLVDDAATKRLSCQFYDLLQKGSSKAQALRQAQLVLLDSARSNSDIKPQSWAPYVLIGNPQ